EPEPLLLLVVGWLDGTRRAAGLRVAGVPVLQLVEVCEPAVAASYAKNAEAGWIGYPESGGVRLARTGSSDSELVGVPEVAERVLS
ncbi:MAG: hypothetical protein L0G70_03835, partial [Rubrobacter sp.]|nr:hypothetical protein [Rubrobacter sp.]